MTFHSALPELINMLKVRRPSSSPTERRFVDHFLRPHGLTEDAYGNLHKRIGTAPVLWSCHTDTVHHRGGLQHITTKGGIIKLAPTEKQSNCLGADCTAGIWVMLQMIRARKPGLYVFHRDEEVGGWGSRHIAKHTPWLLDDIEKAIAFDRRGVADVITHQAYGRCCSDDFAGALASHLGMGYRPDSGGFFTDTANYVDLVPECTNLSVGYFDEHSKRERLNVSVLSRLLEAILDLDVGALPTERVPGTVEYMPRMHGGWASWDSDWVNSSVASTWLTEWRKEHDTV